MISQELRKVMERIERLEPRWELIRGGSRFSAEQESNNPEYGLCFEKQIPEGIIRCEFKAGPTGNSEYDLCGDGHEGDNIFTHYASMKVSLVKHSELDNFICIFNEWYGGAQYVIFRKKTFWKGYIKSYEKKLIKNPSEEYQFLRKYIEMVDASLFKVKTEERLMAEKERQQKYQQQEQECKNIFFGKK